jgi:hypothetical protein
MKAVWITPSDIAAPQAFEVFEITPMHLRAGCSYLFSTRIRASKAKHLVTRVDQFSDNCRADEARRSRDENTHILCSF